jgi:DNA replication protein DnaC
MNQLLDLNLKAMWKAYQEIGDDPLFASQSFDEKFAYLVNREHEYRVNGRIKRRLREAAFKESATLHEVVFTPERNLNRDLLERLATHRWIKNHENIVITGATGTGKSYLAQALGDHACRHNFRVRYYRLPELLTELRFGKQVNRYLNIRNRLKNIDVLILDDWGMATLDVQAGHELAEIVEDRLGQRSTIVVSQFPISTWDKIFQDKTTADAVMDRLIHVAYPIELKGPSMRKQAASDDLKAYREAMIE